MLRITIACIALSFGGLGCSSSPQDNTADAGTTADSGPQPTPCVGESVTIGAACAPNGATCGICNGPPGPLYVCDNGLWRGEIIGFCDDDLPPPPCAKCSTYLTEPGTSLCPSSQVIYDAFFSCTCTRAAADPMPGCADVCSASFCAGLASDVACIECMTNGVCSVDHSACQNDI